MSQLEDYKLQFLIIDGESEVLKALYMVKEIQRIEGSESFFLFFPSENMKYLKKNVHLFKERKKERSLFPQFAEFSIIHYTRMQWDEVLTRHACLPIFPRKRKTRTNVRLIKEEEITVRAAIF